jgi:GNAT superfamily N-acetyltransferase
VGPRDELRTILTEAALGRPPVADGRTRVIGPPGRVQGVFAFTAHTVIATDAGEDELRPQLPEGDLGAAMSPAFLVHLGGCLGIRPGTFDAVFALPPGAAAEGPALVPAPALDHPRVARATRWRDDVHVFTTETGDGVLVVGRGVAGRWEMAYEVDPSARAQGLGRRLAAAARGLVPDAEPLFAQVAPGNAASIRSVLAAGYRPIGAEVLFVRPR